MEIPKKIFDMPVKLGGAVVLNKYPLYFSRSYRCQKASIGNAPCILVEPLAEVKPLQVSKMFEKLSASEGVPCLLMSPSLSAYKRSALSERGVAWVMSEGSFHIPFLAASLNTPRSARGSSDSLSAGAQQIVAHALNGSWDAMTTSEVSAKTGKSLPSVSNYFSEIADAEPSLIGNKGRSRLIVSPKETSERRSAFERLEPRLHSPVKRRHYLVCNEVAQKMCHDLPLSGVSALSARSMLADDPWETRAIAASDKERLSALLKSTEQVDKYDSPNILLEVWSYPPAGDDLVSLYLSLREYASKEHDDRLDEAVAELRGEMLGGQ